MKSVGTLLLEISEPCGQHRGPHNLFFVQTSTDMKGSNLANDLVKQCDESDKVKVCAAGHTGVVDNFMFFAICKSL